MSRLVKIVDNKYVQIEEYRNPNICFNTNEYEDIEDYYILRQTFDPFKIFYENQELKEEVKAVNKGLRKVQERNIKYKNRCFELNKKIYELEEQLEDMTLCRDIASGHRKEVQDRETILLNQQKEFINYLEDEKNRLARECSHIYEDSLGHTRLVNEDIFDEVNDILQKYKEIIGDK